ncbi:MAG TPA: tetratricopeptide repeat protein [Bacteroidaceae bacterium]|nr:tetratricopeptide repeat protein [Bacteroidaceae bacterium]
MICVKSWLRTLFFLVFVHTAFSCGTIADIKDYSNSESDLDNNRGKFNFFFYEALNQISQLNYDSAFDLLKYCLLIDPESAVVRYELSKLYMTINDKTQPEILMKEAVAIDPDNYWYWMLLANYYEKYREYDKSIEIYEAISLKFPSRTDILINLINLYGSSSNYDKMLAALNRLEKIEGKSEQITLSKFNIYIQKDQPDSVYLEIESLMEEYPNDSRYSVLLGEYLIFNGREEEALKLFMENLEKTPSDINSRLALLDYYSTKREDSLLFDQIDYLFSIPETDFELKRQVLSTLVATAATRYIDSDRISEKFQIALSGEQKDASIAEMYAGFLISEGDDINLLTPVFRQILDIEPDNKWAILNLLDRAIHDSQRDEIIRLGSLAVLYTPEELAFYYYIAVAYSQKQMLDDAIATIKKGLGQKNFESDNNVISALFTLLGDIYYESAKYDSCFEAYDSAIIYNSQNYSAMNNYAYLLSQHNGDLDKAEKMSLATIIVESNNYTYLDTYAWILFRKEKYEEAKKYIDRALENGGDKNPDILEHSGDIYYMLGYLDKALSFWNAAVSCGNNSEKLHNKIKQKSIIK